MEPKDKKSRDESKKSGTEFLIAKLGRDKLPDGCVKEIPLLVEAIRALNIKSPSRSFKVDNGRFSFGVMVIMSRFFFQVQIFSDEKKKWFDVPQLIGFTDASDLPAALDKFLVGLEKRGKWTGDQ